ncbi:MAG: Tar ligand binding domain-containing protein [Gammaproteobacteria bacterium]|nr:Tar ligand binding domain-containing protein [Gammaproteobacteria bacterium]
MFRKLSIKAKLTLSAVLSAVFIAIVAGTGLSGMRALDQNVEELLEEQMRPAQQLAIIQDLARMNVESLLRMSQLDPRLNDGREPSSFALEDFADEISGNTEFISMLWDRYLETVRTEEERALALAFEAARSSFVDQGLETTLTFFSTGQFVEGNVTLTRVALPLFETVIDSIGALVTYKNEATAATFESGQARVDRDLAIVTAVVIVSLLLSALLGWLLTRAIVRPAQRAVAVFEAISDDRLDSEILIDADDEMGQILSGLKDMQATLSARLAEERQQAAKAKRTSDALDAVSDSIMVADADYSIVHMNPAAVALFQHREQDFKSILPEFSADRLIGSNMDIFHRDPAHQRALLEKLEGPHGARLKIGEVHLALTATPIRDDAGNRLGTVVQWVDETAQVLAEREVETLVGSAAAGDFSRRMDVTHSSGFFKRLGEGVNSLVEITDSSLAEVIRVLKALAAGDLTERVSGEFAGAFAELQQNTNHTIDQLETLIGEVNTAVDAIGSASREIAAGNTNLSQRTEEQAASLEETASSMEEMTSTVRQNADNARQANQLAQGAREVANSGGDKVRDVVRSMNEITESAQKIENIISVIDGIAFQTNILALNAAVEAARAGEQGRGFAVVASEVRTLAQRSAQAAKEIKDLIGASVKSVEAGNELVAEAGQTMEEIVNSIKRVTDIMSEISAASEEQSQGIEQVNTTVTQLDEMTQQNAALVEEATAAAGAMEQQAEGLARSVSIFRLRGADSAARLQRSVTINPAADKPPASEVRPAVQAAASPTPSKRPVAAKGSAARRAKGTAEAAVGADDADWVEF